MLYTLLAVSSLDGMIARHSFHFTDWASEEDKYHFKSYLDNAELLLVGNNTFKTAKEQLSMRNCIVLTKSIEKIEKISDRLCYINPKSFNVHNYLVDSGYKNVIVLGGAQTYAWAIENRLPSEILLSLEPIIFGKGISFFNPENELARRCKLLSVKQLNEQGTLLLHYKVME